MDKIRSTFGYKRELGGGERNIFGLSYGWVVQAHSNRSIVKLSVLYKVWNFSVLVSHAHSCLYYFCIIEEHDNYVGPIVNLRYVCGSNLMFSPCLSPTRSPSNTIAYGVPRSWLYFALMHCKTLCFFFKVGNPYWYIWITNI